MDLFGSSFRITLFGESHGKAIGVVIDGVRPGIALSESDFACDILRRKAGKPGTTSRTEDDDPEILSGVHEGHTTGAPIAIIFKNKESRSADYEALQGIPRPGHADYSASVKFDGFNDPRGGGHFSGRLTLPLVAAGVVAKKMCDVIGFKAELVEVGGEKDSSLWDGLLEAAAREGDSLGGIVGCTVSNVPAGLGEPFFDSVESLISHAMFSIPGVRGVEFGDGFQAAGMKGSGHNDAFGRDADGKVIPLTNGAGGVNGGITNGAPVSFRVAFKPTSSIPKVQKTLNMLTDQTVELSVRGRHDVCFALRTPVVVEAMSAIVLADLLARK